MNKQLIFIAVMTLTLLASCKSKEITTAAFHDYTTECIGKSMDGTQTLRVWASGRNRADAIEQAQKKAVYDVVFAGIQAGGGGCNASADGGAYPQYVSMANQKTSAMQRHYGDGTQTFGIIVTVNRSALRQRFEHDNIIVKQ